MPLHLRALTATEREAVFSAHPNEYDAAIRQMQQGVAYAIELGSSTSMSIRRRFTNASKRRGVKLRWGKTATALVLELRP